VTHDDCKCRIKFIELQFELENITWGLGNRKHEGGILLLSVLLGNHLDDLNRFFRSNFPLLSEIDASTVKHFEYLASRRFNAFRLGCLLFTPRLCTLHVGMQLLELATITFYYINITNRPRRFFSRFTRIFVPFYPLDFSPSVVAQLSWWLGSLSFHYTFWFIFFSIHWHMHTFTASS